MSLKHLFSRRLQTPKYILLYHFLSFVISPDTSHSVLHNLFSPACLIQTLTFYFTYFHTHFLSTSPLFPHLRVTSRSALARVTTRCSRICLLFRALKSCYFVRLARMTLFCERFLPALYSRCSADKRVRHPNAPPTPSSFLFFSIPW